VENIVVEYVKAGNFWDDPRMHQLNLWCRLCSYSCWPSE